MNVRPVRDGAASSYRRIGRRTILGTIAIVIASSGGALMWRLDIPEILAAIVFGLLTAIMLGCLQILVALERTKREVLRQVRTEVASGRREIEEQRGRLRAIEKRLVSVDRTLEGVSRALEDHSVSLNRALEAHLRSVDHALERPAMDEQLREVPSSLSAQGELIEALRSDVLALQDAVRGQVIAVSSVERRFTNPVPSQDGRP
jgi:septal ring factor EnvC (AmiA/AmiB activator)